MRKLSFIPVIAVSLLMLSGCQNTKTPEGVFNAYLETLKSGKVEKQKDLTCRLQALEVKNPLLEVQKWEITGQETKANEEDSESKYHLLAVRISEKSLGGMVVDRTWKFKVWKSDELFESHKRLFDKLNRGSAQAIESVRQLQKMAGETPMEAAKPVVTDRKEYSSNSYCVSNYEPKEQ
ncbi:MAG: hypothetical protein KME13_23910 [Myxacorys californica WJT36-NPBG1]|jgi:hypothetical protein|nr:hypothetical protein [Myxacorys californica WJT36-NPBG1]